MNILICENEEILLTALEFRMRKQGFNLMIAKSGDEARKIIQSHSPDLLIIDILKPQIEGLEVIKFATKHLQTFIPIIAISSLDEGDVILEAFRLGANDFITKPFNPTELILRVRRIFQEVEVAG